MTEPAGPGRARLTVAARGLVSRLSVVEWAALALTVYLVAPPRSLVPVTGLDPSWQATLALARHHEDGGGAGLVFTYGPWGWVNHPMADSRLDVAVAVVFGVVAVLVAWSGLRALLARGARRPWAAVGASALVLLMMPAYTITVTLVVGVVAWVLLHLVESRPLGFGATVGLPAAAALVLQVKFSDGVVVGAVVALGCVVAARPLWRLALALGSYLGTTVLAWLLAGGSLGDLPEWLRLSFQVARHFSDSMSVENEPNTLSYLLIGVTVVASLLLVVAGHRRLPRLALGGLVLVCLAVLFVGFRESTTRHELVRLGAFELGVPVFVAAVHHWRGRTAALLVLGFAVLIGNNNLVYVDPAKARLLWANTVEVLVDPAYQRDVLASAGETGREQYAVPPELLEAIGRRPLSVDGFEVALPWYYGRRWDAMPVLQSYSAYSEALDDADTAWLESRSDDHRILRPPATGIDGRNTLWDPPSYVLAELCSTRAVASSDRWLLLAKDGDRCSEPATVETRELATGEELELPASSEDQIVTVSFDEGSPGLLVTLGRLAFKSLHPLTATVDGSTEFRVPRALAAGPLVTQVPADLGWPAQFGGGTAYRTIAFSEPGTATVRVIDLE